jgi:hypothetical protein
LFFFVAIFSPHDTQGWIIALSVVLKKRRKLKEEQEGKATVDPYEEERKRIEEEKWVFMFVC